MLVCVCVCARCARVWDEVSIPRACIRAWVRMWVHAHVCVHDRLGLSEHVRADDFPTCVLPHVLQVVPLLLVPVCLMSRRGRLVPVHDAVQVNRRTDGGQDTPESRPACTVLVGSQMKGVVLRGGHDSDSDRSNGNDAGDGDHETKLAIATVTLKETTTVMGRQLQQQQQDDRDKDKVG